MSEIRATTISDAAGTGPIALTKQSAAKAWANINGTPVTRDSQNVSSVTDNGTGDHTLNFANNMGNALYASTLTTHFGVCYVAQSGGNPLDYTASTIRINTVNASSLNSKADKDSYYGAIHGDLA